MPLKVPSLLCGFVGIKKSSWTSNSKGNAALDAHLEKACGLQASNSIHSLQPKWGGWAISEHTFSL